MKLDNTLDDIQHSRFHNLYHDFIKKTLKHSSFTEQEITCILIVYYKYVLVNGKRAKYMSRLQFFSFFDVIFDIYEVDIMERILMTIARDSRKDILPQAWLKIFTIYMKSSLEEKMKFCFSVYDVEETGFLTRELISRYAEKCIIGEDDEVEGLAADLTDLLIRRMDVDRDGFISYNDYAETVRKTPRLLQFLGKCMPDRVGIISAAHCCNIFSVLESYGVAGFKN